MAALAKNQASWQSILLDCASHLAFFKELIQTLFLSVSLQTPKENWGHLTHGIPPLPLIHLIESASSKKSIPHPGITQESATL